jgi:HNH endonuclease
MKKTPLERFNLKTTKNKSSGCVEWIASKNKFGYGKFSLNKGWVFAHRWIYEHTFQNKIPKNKYVLHKCDNPKCVNVEHLFLGTKADNSKDRDLKNRGWWKNGHKHFSKLSEENVKEIRLLRNEKQLSYKQIGEKYGVSLYTVFDVVHKRNWQHI